jgi:hypothetical protein
VNTSLPWIGMQTRLMSKHSNESDLYQEIPTTCKLKLFLRLIKLRAMKASGKLEVDLHSFSSSTLDKSRYSISRAGHHIPKQTSPVTHRIRDWLGPRTCLGPEKERKSCPTWRADRRQNALPTVLSLLTPNHLWHNYYNSLRVHSSPGFKPVTEDNQHAYTNREVQV